MWQLKIEDLKVSYDGMHALSGISLEIQKNEVIGILGGNGAGKSTLINTISGLLKPEGGSIIYEGEDLLKLRPYEIVELGIIQVPEGRNLFPLLTVEENLFVGSYVKVARGLRKQSLEEVYGLLPILKDRSKQLAKTLSGGEQQMLALGRGLMAKPKLLMLDEPTLGLAPKIVADVFRILNEIHIKGITIILSEQNVVKSLQAADKAFIIENGVVSIKGTGQEMLHNEYIKKAFMGI
jgi:branched-chain amino acid transport system ATP-binding protein